MLTLDGDREVCLESLPCLGKIRSRIDKKSLRAPKKTNLEGAGTGFGTQRGRCSSVMLISTMNLETNFAECFGHVLSNVV